MSQPTKGEGGGGKRAVVARPDDGNVGGGDVDAVDIDANAANTTAANTMPDEDHSPYYATAAAAAAAAAHNDHNIDDNIDDNIDEDEDDILRGQQWIDGVPETKEDASIETREGPITAASATAATISTSTTSIRNHHQQQQQQQQQLNVIDSSGASQFARLVRGWETYINHGTKNVQRGLQTFNLCGEGLVRIKGSDDSNNSNNNDQHHDENMLAAPIVLRHTHSSPLNYSTMFDTDTSDPHQLLPANNTAAGGLNSNNNNNNNSYYNNMRRSSSTPSTAFRQRSEGSAFGTNLRPMPYLGPDDRSAFTLPMHRTSYAATRTTAATDSGTRYSAFNPILAQRRRGGHEDETEQTSIEVMDMGGRRFNNNNDDDDDPTKETNSSQKWHGAKKAKQFLKDNVRLRRRRRRGGRENPAGPPSVSSSSSASKSGGVEVEVKVVEQTNASGGGGGSNNSCISADGDDGGTTSSDSRDKKLPAVEPSLGGSNNNNNNNNKNNSSSNNNNNDRNDDRRIVTNPETQPAFQMTADDDDDGDDEHDGVPHQRERIDSQDTTSRYHQLDSDADEEYVHYRGIEAIHGSPATVPSPAYQQFVDRGETPPTVRIQTSARSPAAAASRMESPTTVRRTASQDSGAESPGTAMSTLTSNTSGQTTLGTSTSGTVSSGRLTILSAVSETDREVMETNKAGRGLRLQHESRGRLKNELDGDATVHSSSTTSTATHGYLALGSPSLRDGASMPMDRFFKASRIPVVHSASHNSGSSSSGASGGSGSEANARPAAQPMQRMNSHLTQSSARPFGASGVSVGKSVSSGSTSSDDPPKFVSYLDQQPSADTAKTVGRGNTRSSPPVLTRTRVPEDCESPAQLVDYSHGVVFEAAKPDSQKLFRPVKKRESNNSARPPLSPIKGLRTPTTPPPHLISPYSGGNYQQLASPPNIVDHHIQGTPDLSKPYVLRTTAPPRPKMVASPEQRGGASNPAVPSDNRESSSSESSYQIAVVERSRTYRETSIEVAKSSKEALNSASNSISTTVSAAVVTPEKARDVSS